MAQSRRRQKRNSPAKHAPPPKMLDLSQFASLDEAVAKVEPGDRYLEVGKLLMPLDGGGMPMTLTTLFGSR